MRRHLVELLARPQRWCARMPWMACPVLDGRRLLGIVTVSDMLDAVDDTDGVLSSV